MHKAVKIALSTCWIAVFGTLAIIAMVAATDGLDVARAAVPFAVPLLGIEPLASEPMMGGLSLGSAIVTSLFLWMLLTALIGDDDWSRGIDNPSELAHGGAFGIGGVIFLATVLDASVPIMISCGLLVAALVISLLLSRIGPEPKQTLAPREVRDRAIEAAHVYSVEFKQPSAEIVHFPMRGEFARGGQ
ncbi:hypothetical protein [Mesorhizobium sp. Z1-4]|uniref:hypothetical protein n=1 Tax=Mesorhizobium sp. Z1-4 TaxID=2448478 RepID=UPI000FDCD571|nr:hypothetical protein [Mesorhizobium sp. Z1-4]